MLNTHTLKKLSVFVFALFVGQLVTPALATSIDIAPFLQMRVAAYEKAREMGEKKGIEAFLNAMDPKFNRQDRKYFTGMFRGVVKFPEAKYVAPDTVELWFAGEDKGFPLQLLNVEKRLIRIDGKDFTVPKGSFEAIFTGVLNHLMQEYGAGSKKKHASFSFSLIPEAQASGALSWVRSWPIWGKALGIAGLAAGTAGFAYLALGSGDKDKNDGGGPKDKHKPAATPT